MTQAEGHPLGPTPNVDLAGKVGLVTARRAPMIITGVTLRINDGWMAQQGEHHDVDA